jgi:hypothetical protein
MVLSVLFGDTKPSTFPDRFSRVLVLAGHGTELRMVPEIDTDSPILYQGTGLDLLHRPMCETQ